MVKIIDGMIVQDDDPRAKEWERRRQRSSGSGPSTSGTRYTNAGDHGQAGQLGTGFSGFPGMQQGRAPTQGFQNGQSPFQDINARLTGLGIPTWQIAGRDVQPIVSVALVVAAVFSGLHGIVVVGLLWFIFGRS